MPAMGRRDRLRATVARQPTDRPAYAFWRHFPSADRSPAGLAQATLRFHDRYGSDFLALVPPAGYAAQAWGCEEGDVAGPDGARACARCAVRRPEDWRTIRPLDPAAAPGYLEVLETVVRVGFDRRIDDAPVLLTLASPLAVAARLAGGRLAADLREWPGLVQDALRAIAETQVRFAELCLTEGLAGVLYTVPPTPAGPLGDHGWAEAAESSDRTLLEALGHRGALRVVLGQEPTAYRRLAGLPADLVGPLPPGGPAGTDPRATGPAGLGGLEAPALLEAPAAMALDAARATLAAHGGRGVVIAPDGPVWPGTPDATLAAIVRGLGGTPRPILGLTR